MCDSRRRIRCRSIAEVDTGLPPLARACVPKGLFLRCLIVAAVALIGLFMTERCLAAPVLEGDITLSFSRIVDGQGNVTGYHYDGATANLNVSAGIPIVIDTSVTPYASAQPVSYWSDPLIWTEGPAILFIDAVIVGKAVYGAGTGEPSLMDTWDAVNVLQSTGPTEKSISVLPLKITSPDILGFEASFGATGIFKFNVNIPAPAHVVMDHDAIVESLTIEAGGWLENPSKNLTLRRLSQNSGRLTLNGGSLVAQSGVVNAGNFEWSGGNIAGDFTNSSDTLTVIGDPTKTRSVGAGGVLNNAGTITAGQGANVYMGSSVSNTVNNLAGAVWDFQGDDNYLGGDSTNGARIIDNAGTFRKSSGTGVSSLGSNGPESAFINRGVVEVTSGTLLIGNGSNQGGTFVFANGGRAILRASYDLYGDVTAQGEGVLEVDSAAVLAAAGQTATIRDFTGGARFVVSPGWSNTATIGAKAGGTLRLELLGSSKVEMTGGNIGGAGTTVNAGNFEWSGGNIAGDFTNSSDTLTVIGDPTKTRSVGAGGVLNNAGTVSAGQGANVFLIAGSTVNNLPGAVWEFLGDDNYLGGDSTSGSRVIDNVGTFRKSSGTGTTSLSSNGPGSAFINRGLVEITSGTLAFYGEFEQTAGESRLAGGALAFETAQIEGGMLTGPGTVSGNIINSGGLVSPGASAGTMVTNGTYTQGSSGSLLIELGGLLDGQFDFLDVNGPACLDGRLEIAFLDGFWPQVGDTFRVLEYSSRFGTFADIDVLTSGYTFDALYGSTGMTLVTTAVPEPATLGLLAAGIGLFMARRLCGAAPRKARLCADI